MFHERHAISQKGKKADSFLFLAPFFSHVSWFGLFSRHVQCHLHTGGSGCAQKEGQVQLFRGPAGWQLEGQGALDEHVAGETQVSVCDCGGDAVKSQQASRRSNHSFVGNLGRPPVDHGSGKKGFESGWEFANEIHCRPYRPGPSEGALIAVLRMNSFSTPRQSSTTHIPRQCILVVFSPPSVWSCINVEVMRACFVLPALVRELRRLLQSKTFARFLPPSDAKAKLTTTSHVLHSFPAAPIIIRLGGSMSNPQYSPFLTPNYL